MVRAIHYSFRQTLRVSARKAFEWCTNYTREDHVLMKEDKAVREIQQVSDDTIILTDKYFGEGKSVIKQKLVCLYPTLLMWTSTHLTGPNIHSQFLYEIVPQSSQRCRLRFTALYLDYSVKDREVAERLSKVLLKLDMDIWRLLAKEMASDFRKR